MEQKRNVNGNWAIVLENRPEGDFVNENVVNLFKQEVNYMGIFLRSKELIFISSCNNIDKAKLKMELDAFGRILHIKQYICNSKKYIHRDMYKPKFINLRKQNVAMNCTSAV